MLPRVAGRPLAEVSGPRPGEQIGIHLRYLVNGRLLTAGELATLQDRLWERLAERLGAVAPLLPDTSQLDDVAVLASARAAPVRSEA